MILLHDTSKMALQEDDLFNISKENKAKLKSWKFMILVLVELQNSVSRRRILTFNFAFQNPRQNQNSDLETPES